MLDAYSTGLKSDHPAAGNGSNGWPLLQWTGVVIIAASALLFLFNTRHGIGILPDSTRYMGLDERPYDAPIYAWLVQGIAATGVRIELGAKILGLLIVCANSYLVWRILAKATANFLYAAVGAAIIVFSPHFVGLHAVAMSEPLFITFILISILLLRRYLHTEKQIWLVACGVAVGLTALVRFAGVPLGAAIAAFLLLRSRHPLSRRVVEAVTVALASGLVFGTWLVFAKLFSGHTLGREFAFNGSLAIKQWLIGLNTLTTLLMPSQIPFLVRVVLLLLVSIGCAYLGADFIRRVRGRQASNDAAMLVALLAWFMLFYVAFLMLSVKVEANLLLNARYGFPVYVTTVMLIAIILAHTSRSGGLAKYAHCGIVGMAAIVLAMHLARTLDRTRDAYIEGLGFASRAWMNSPIIQAVKKLPEDAAIYSNAVDAIRFITGRTSRYVPMRFNNRTGKDRLDNPFETQLEELRRELPSGKIYVVYADRVDWRPYLIKEQELQNLLGLELVANESNGRIYALPAKEQ